MAGEARQRRSDEVPPPIPPAPGGTLGGGYGAGAQPPYGTYGTYGTYGAYGPQGPGTGPAGPAGPYGPGASPYGPVQAPGPGRLPGYGAAAYGWQGPPPPSGLSTAAMVLGIVSIVLILTLWGSFLSVITSGLALGLGIRARRRVRRGELGGQGQATAGFVLGIVGLCLSVLVSALLVVGLTVGSDDDGSGPGGGGSGGGSSTYDARR
ncbi:DUF4190 domain-containing protein [Streptomyces boncukensis]|uniref:DUF4190 domain-containing protein n=1 Tax=Streptomyces boncukensis TaxID=2711219 RepID=A0A6G4WSP2_9ACTN|nr:DUF4190 domain-containing protein [Streptomyces boncukensis]NGO68128.1 DUF4190 domain-containing protein [Streptomyces boncukensis]